jgi:hypothetical protein
VARRAGTRLLHEAEGGPPHEGAGCGALYAHPEVVGDRELVAHFTLEETASLRKEGNPVMGASLPASCTVVVVFDVSLFGRREKRGVHMLVVLCLFLDAYAYVLNYNPNK